MGKAGGEKWTQRERERERERQTDRQTERKGRRQDGWEGERGERKKGEREYR